MKIKKYVVEDVKEALKRIKNELGEDAVILQTRKFKKGGFLGIGRKIRYEVTAVADDKNQNKNEQSRNTSNKDEQGWVDSEKIYELKRILSKNRDVTPPEQKKPVRNQNQAPTIPNFSYQDNSRNRSGQNQQNPRQRQTAEETVEQKSRANLRNDRGVSDLRKEVISIKRMMQELSSKVGKENYLPGIPEDYRKIFRSLKKQEINEDISRNIVESLRIITERNTETSMDFEKRFTDIVHPLIKTENPLKEHDRGDIIFFVGPTGVGKTTTLTKIAAMLSLEMRKKIGILTIDTYRIAAVDQLKTSADIMGIEVGVAYNPGELKTMLEKFKNYDLVLVDTAGRSQKNEMQMSELTRYLQIIEPEYVFLTGSMNTRISDLFDIVEHFSVVSPTHLILTKMDETRIYGSLIELTNNYDIPISYVTNGQRIPEDIMMGNSKRLASLLVKEVLKDARSN